MVIQRMEQSKSNIRGMPKTLEETILSIFSSLSNLFFSAIVTTSSLILLA